MKTLNVFHDQQLLGVLYDSEPLSFLYVGDCADGRATSPFADVIPVSSEPQSGPEVAAFFENLLPEGEQRAVVEARHHVSTVFGLLSVLGGETIGSLVITPGDHVDAKHYLDTTWGSILHSREALSEEEAAARVQGNTISGAQHKILLYLDSPDAPPQLPMGGALTTHILKPDIKHTIAKVWASAANETLIMMAAERCGLDVAKVRYIQEAQSCLVARFDRHRDAEGNWHRYHQADLCQLLGLKSDAKYERDNGPSFAQCYQLVRQKSTAPALDLQRMLKWLLYNLYVGNGDSHAKNLSMLYRDGGMVLSPFYDLMNTSIYSGLSKDFAFSIGGEFALGKLNSGHLAALAKAINASPKGVQSMALEMAEKTSEAIQRAAAELSPQVAPTERTAIQRIEQWVISNTRKMAARFAEPLPDPGKATAPTI